MQYCLVDRHPNSGIQHWLLLDDPALEVDVNIVAHGPFDDTLAAATKARAEAEMAAKKAAQLTEKAARELVDDGLTVSDAGRLLGVSAQRVSQLVG